MNILTSFSDLVFPRYCAVCGVSVDRAGRHVCSECLDRLPFVPTDGLCRRCGRDAPALDGEYLCGDCRTRHPAFDRAASVLRFEGAARELVNAFKFRRAFHLRSDFADWLEAAARARFRVGEIAGVVPMPATRWHRFLRGYNPAGVLANALAQRLKARTLPLLARCGSPKRQGGLDEAARRENVKGTFRFRGSRRVGHLEGPVLMVDDIMTTGATLNEAAHTLKAAGVKTVWALSLARSIRY